MLPFRFWGKNCHLSIIRWWIDFNWIGQSTVDEWIDHLPPKFLPCCLNWKTKWKQKIFLFWSFVFLLKQCTYIYTHIHTYIHRYIYVYIHLYLNICVRAHIQFSSPQLCASSSKKRPFNNGTVCRKRNLISGFCLLHKQALCWQSSAHDSEPRALMKDCFPSSKFKAARACNSLPVRQPGNFEALLPLPSSAGPCRQQRSRSSDGRILFISWAEESRSRLSSHLRVNSEYSKAL